MTPSDETTELPSCRLCVGRDACFLAGGAASGAFRSLRGGRRAIDLQSGEVLFSEGETPFGVWLVCRGRISVIKRQAAGDQVTLRVSYPGDLVGYRSFFAGQPFQASALALERSSLLFLDQLFMEGLVRQNHGASIQLLRKLSHDLGHAEAVVTTIDQMQARLRVIRVIRELQHLRDDGAVGAWWRLPVRPQDISVLAGLPFDVTLTVLNELQTEGVLSLEGKQISLVRDHEWSSGQAE